MLGSEQYIHIQPMCIGLDCLCILRLLFSAHVVSAGIPKLPFRISDTVKTRDHRGV